MVDRGAMPTSRRTVDQGQMVSAGEFQMPRATRCDRDHATRDGHVVARFDHLSRTDVIQPIHQRWKEMWLYVLHNHRGGAIPRVRSEDPFQCFDPAGGASDQHHWPRSIALHWFARRSRPCAVQMSIQPVKECGHMFPLSPFSLNIRFGNISAANDDVRLAQHFQQGLDHQEIIGLGQICGHHDQIGR